ncbi:MAG: HmuY family protein [Chitinophagales bacterium]
MTLIFCIVLLLSSCFKEEEPRDAVSIGTTIEMGSDYFNQVFYNIASNEVVSVNSYETWHLGFYAQADDYFIRLNAARVMYAFPTGEFNFENVTSLDENLTGDIDHQSGDRSRLALDVNFVESGDTAYSNSEVYILDLGTNEAGDYYGYKKIVFEKVSGNSYYIRFANLDNSEMYKAVVTKDETLNYVAFSLDNEGEVVNVEPDRNTWDLVFTNFTAEIDTLGSLIPYSVTGAYFNPFFVEGYQINDNTFDDFSTNDINESLFDNQLDIIGHDWKVFSLEDNQYYIYNNKVYILKDINDNYYKLRFLDFYSQETGDKGYPTFEIQPL